jgi:hypothetical protein
MPLPLLLLQPGEETDHDSYPYTPRTRGDARPSMADGFAGHWWPICSQAKQPAAMV